MTKFYFKNYADLIEYGIMKLLGGINMKREEGNLVRIKDNLKPENYYGGYFFADRMANFNGETAKVVKVKGSAYELDIDGGEWSWSDEMLEDLKFEEGDKIKIRKSCKLEEIEDDWDCTIRFLNRLCYNELDHVFTVTDVNDDGSIDVEDDSASSNSGRYVSTIIFDIAEKSVKEMTLAEVCKELGYNVKIIKE